MGKKKEEDSIILHIAVQPKASEDRIVSFHGEALKVKVTAPPTEGKANQRLIQVLAERLNIGQSRIEIIQGHKSRRKVLRIWNVSSNQVRNALKPKNKE
ncbi:MAG: YggU family protein [Syntrophobacterales bacterium]|nr:MAG: YggU family protein [Syntrophobacterales bacterium]